MCIYIYIYICMYIGVDSQGWNSWVQGAFPAEIQAQRVLVCGFLVRGLAVPFGRCENTGIGKKVMGPNSRGKSLDTLSRGIIQYSHRLYS